MGETRQATLHDGSIATVKLLRVQEERASVVGMIKAACADVEVNGEPATLSLGHYNLPDTAADVYNGDASLDSWAVHRDARFRLWPADAPIQLFFRIEISFIYSAARPPMSLRRRFVPTKRYAS